MSNESKNLDDLWRESLEDHEAKPEGKQRGAIAQFFAENWLWIVVPAVLVVVSLLALALYIQSRGNEEGESTPFTYTTY